MNNETTVYKNINISGVFTNKDQSLTFNIYPGFDPTYMEITRIQYCSVTNNDPDSIFLLTSSVTGEVLSALTIADGIAVDREGKDIFNIFTQVNGSYWFRLTGIDGGLIGENTTIQLSLNLKFYKVNNIEQKYIDKK